MPPVKPISQCEVDFANLANSVRFAQIKKLAKESAGIIQAEAESLAHGSIRDSFLQKVDRYSTIDSVEVRIGPNKEHWYARFFETGTRPHEIRIKTKRTLADRQRGLFFGKTVNHPGMKADPILSRAVTRVGPEAADHFAQGIDDIIHKTFA